MAVAYPGSVFSSGGSGTSPQSVTLPSGSNRIAIFSLHTEATGATTPVTLSSVTYGAGADPLTFLGRETYVGGAGAVETIELWYLLESQMLSGANNFAWTIATGTSAATRIGVLTFTGVNQTTPVNEFVNSTFVSTTTPTALSVTNTTGGACAIWTTLNPQSVTHDFSASGFTKLTDLSIATNASRGIAYIVGDGLQTATFTLSATGSGCQILVSFNAVGVGTPVLDVSGVTGLSHTGTATATGTDFGASQGTVTLDGQSQTVTAWSDTSVSFTVARGTSRYGTVTIGVTRQDGTSSDTIGATLTPQTGWDYIDLAGTLASSGSRITALPDLASGDQLAFGTVIGSGSIVTGVAGVDVFADASYAADDWVTAFDVEANDGTGWGTSATQTIGSSTASTGGPIRSPIRSPIRGAVRGTIH